MLGGFLGAYLWRNPWSSRRKSPEEFLEKSLKKSSDEFLEKSPEEFLWKIPGGVLGDIFWEILEIPGGTAIGIPLRNVKYPEQCLRISPQESLKSPEEFLDEISGEIPGVDSQRNSWRKAPDEFWKQPEGISVENPRQNFWSKSLEEFLEESPKVFWWTSLEKFLEKISRGIPGENPWRNSWRKSPEEFSEENPRKFHGKKSSEEI